MPVIPNPLNLSGEGDVLPAAGFEIILERRRVGELLMPTGRLVACDPLTMPETEPFQLDVPRGNHPVYAIVARGREQVRTAYGVIEFSENRPHRWEIAKLDGEEPTWSGDRPAFQVESNVAAFLDDRTADVLMHLLQYGDSDDADELEKTIYRELHKGIRAGNKSPFASIEIDPRNDGNLIAFDADHGMYVTYFGFDGDGEVCMAVLDFEVLDYQFTPFGLRY